MADSQAGCEETKDQERLCAGLVGHIVLDGVWDEILGLEEDLQQPVMSDSRLDTDQALSPTQSSWKLEDHVQTMASGFKKDRSMEHSNGLAGQGAPSTVLAANSQRVIKSCCPQNNESGGLQQRQPVLGYSLQGAGCGHMQMHQKIRQKAQEVA